MRKFIVKAILKTYVKIRTVTGPKIFKLFYSKKVYPSIWKDVKDLNMLEFSKKINSYEYRWEKLKGLLDASFNPKQPDYFFSKLPDNRDCFLGDTPVVCKNNDNIQIIKISDMYNLIIKNQKLEVLNAASKWVPVLWMNKKQTKTKNILLQGPKGTLGVTEDHPVFDGTTFVEAKNFNLTHNYTTYSYLQHFLTLQKNNNPFPENLYWAFGFFCADGYAAQYINRYFICITNTNKTYIMKTLNLLNEYFTVESYPPPFKKTNYPSDQAGNIRGKAILKHKQHKIICMFRALPKQQRKEILDLFLGFYNSDKEKCIPDFIFKSNTAAIQQFIDGYWAGNGTKYLPKISSDRNLLTIPTQQLAFQLNVLYKILGYTKTKITQDGNKNAYTLYVGNTNKGNSSSAFNTTKIKSKPKNKYVYDIGVLGSVFLINQYLVHNCDDFARIWRVYANEHQMPAWEVIITDIRHPFKKAHVITIAKMEGLYWLFNYNPYGPFKSFEDAVEAMYDFSYSKEYSVWVNYPFEKEKY